MGSYTASELERDTGFGRRTIAYYIQEGLLPRVGRRGPRTRYPELVRDRLLFIRRVREAEAESEIRPVRLSDLRELFEAMPRRLVASVAAGETPMTPDVVSLSSLEQRSMVDRVAALRERLGSGRSRVADASRVRSAREPGERFPAMERSETPRLESLHSPRLFEEEGLAAEEVVAEEEVLADAADPAPRDEVMVASPGARYENVMEPGEDYDALRRQLGWLLRRLQTQARRGRRRSPDSVANWSQVEVTSNIRLSVRGMPDEDAFLLRMAGRHLRLLLEGGTPESSSREPEE